jgi:cytosine/adenosine deaminase-related metal-dependent hydrolase
MTCDILIEGAAVLAMDAAGTIHAPGYVAITGERIVALGAGRGRDAPEAWDAPSIIAGSGLIVMPGFVNTHTHVAMAAFRGLGEDVPDRLRRFIFPLEKRLVTRELVRRASEFCIAEMLRSGTTTFADMYYFEDEVAHAARRLHIRALLGETVVDFPSPDSAEAYGGIAYAGRFAAEWRGDSLVSPCFAPHAPYTVADDKLRETCEEARRLGARILMHVAETEAERDLYAARGTSTLRHLDSLGCLGPDFVAAHMIHVDAADIELAAARGMGVAHCPASNSKGGRPIAAASTMVEAGVRLGLATDGPLSGNGMDMQGIVGLYPKLQKVRLGRRDVVSAQDAVYAATIGGAGALGLDDITGSLEPGKMADILVADARSFSMLPVHDWYSTVAFSMRPSDVAWVLVGGKIVRDRSGLTTVDEEELLDSIIRVAEDCRREQAGL